MRLRISASNLDQCSRLASFLRLKLAATFGTRSARKPAASSASAWLSYDFQWTTRPSLKVQTCAYLPSGTSISVERPTFAGRSAQPREPRRRRARTRTPRSPRRPANRARTGSTLLGAVIDAIEVEDLGVGEVPHHVRVEKDPAPPRGSRLRNTSKALRSRSTFCRLIVHASIAQLGFRPGFMASKKQIDVGGVKIGGGAPVAVQSMTKTETADFDATMKQIHAIAEAGGDLVRCAVPRDNDVRALERIVKESPIPVIADIHFNYTLALKAIDAGAHCIRINPGNIGGQDKAAQVVEKATAGRCADADRRELRLAPEAPPRARAGEPRRGARGRRRRARRADGPARLRGLQGVDQVDERAQHDRVEPAALARRSTTRSTSASPRPARSGPARSSRRSASARCWPTGSATRSASRSPPSTRRRRSRSPGRS